jgi:hypothetical protein
MPMRLPLLALAAGLLVVSPAAAAPPASSAARHAEIHLLLGQLHTAKKLLETAIHDYDGHRAKAVHEVHEAIKLLEEHHKAHAAVTGQPTVPSARPAQAQPAPQPEITQAQSDAQLKQAATLIQGVETVLSTSSQTHHVKATAHLNDAVKELGIAVSIK